MLCKELRRAALAKDQAGELGLSRCVGCVCADEIAIAAVEEDVDLFITEMQRVGVVMQLAWVQCMWNLQLLMTAGARQWLSPR